MYFSLTHLTLQRCTPPCDARQHSVRQQPRRRAGLTGKQSRTQQTRRPQASPSSACDWSAITTSKVRVSEYMDGMTCDVLPTDMASGAQVGLGLKCTMMAASYEGCSASGSNNLLALVVTASKYRAVYVPQTVAQRSGLITLEAVVYACLPVAEWKVVRAECFHCILCSTSGDLADDKEQAGHANFSTGMITATMSSSCRMCSGGHAQSLCIRLLPH